MVTARRLGAWRRRLERRRPLRDLEVRVPGARRVYTLAVPADPDAVLDEVAAALEAPAAPSGTPAAAGRHATAARAQVHMPYWATLWASGLALAEAALARPAALRGRRAIELGCGLGVTAAAALEAGAALLAVDCFAEALAFCRYNAARNAGAAPRTLLADWRTAAGCAKLRAGERFDLVLAADVLYEPEDVAPLLALVPRLLAPAGAFWLAEPGRVTSEQFVAAARAAGWCADTVEVERDWPAGVGPARVRLHFYSPKSEV